MRQRHRKHVYINRMRNPESDHAATRRILRELRELTAALDAAGTSHVPSLRDGALLSNDSDAVARRVRVRRAAQAQLRAHEARDRLAVELEARERDE